MSLSHTLHAIQSCLETDRHLDLNIIRNEHRFTGLCFLPDRYNSIVILGHLYRMFLIRSLKHSPLCCPPDNNAIRLGV